MIQNNECYIKIPINCSNNTPNIRENGNWYIGDADTGIKAQGKDGEPGVKGDPGEMGPNGPTGPQGIQGLTGSQGSAGSFANMDIVFEGKANAVGHTYNLLKPITDYKVIAVEYGFPVSVSSNNFGSSLEWTINPQVSLSVRCYRGIRMINAFPNKDNRTIIFWNFPTKMTFVVGEKMIPDPDLVFGITKIYGFK